MAVPCECLGCATPPVPFSSLAAPHHQARARALLRTRLHLFLSDWQPREASNDLTGERSDPRAVLGNIGCEDRSKRVFHWRPRGGCGCPLLFTSCFWGGGKLKAQEFCGEKRRSQELLETFAFAGAHSSLWAETLG